MASPLYQTIEDTVKAFIASYEEAVGTSNPALLSKTLADTCLRKVEPADFLRAMGQDPDAKMDNAAYIEHMGPQFMAMEDGKCNILSIAVDTVKRSAVARVEHNCKLPGKDWICVEIGWFLEFTEDGTRISAITEFLDTHGITLFIRGLQELMAAAAAK